MTTVPGFSSRASTNSVQQFPQRDEATVLEPGFSNSKHVPDPKPADFHTPGDEAHADSVLEPGWTNSGAAVADGAVDDGDAETVADADSKVIEPSSVEDKAVNPRARAKKGN